MCFTIGFSSIIKFRGTVYANVIFSALSPQPVSEIVQSSNSLDPKNWLCLLEKVEQKLMLCLWATVEFWKRRLWNLFPKGFQRRGRAVLTLFLFSFKVSHSISILTHTKGIKGWFFPILLWKCEKNRLVWL